MGQRFLANAALVPAVKQDANDDGRHHKGDRPVTDDLGLVLFEEIDRVLDFERKLVGLQLFTRDSSHENLR